MDEVAPAAWDAVIAVTAEPADCDAVTHREIGDAVTEFCDGSGDFMARRQRPRDVREAAVDEGTVGAAHAARGNRNPNFVTAGGCRFDVD
jgi:TPP-dependent trihydroxycyclohexane-1,2-dione (THcHDO) dehydratase